MSLKGTPTWRFHTKLYKFRQIVFPNISHLKYCTDLIFGKTFCIFIFFHFPDSRRSVLNGLHFYFSLRDSANREYACINKRKFKGLNSRETRIAERRFLTGLQRGYFF